MNVGKVYFSDRMALNHAAINPVFTRKSAKEYPKEVPMIILGGSPHMVAEPPRLAQKISDRIMGMGLNFKSFANSTVTAAKNRITVMLSINMANTEERIIKVRNSGTGL